MTKKAIKRYYNSVFRIYVLIRETDNLILNNKIADVCHTHRYFTEITNSGCRRQPWIFIAPTMYEPDFPDFPT